MRAVHATAPGLFLCLVLAMPLIAQPGQNDIVQLGLRGPVQTLLEKSAEYKQSSSGWIEQYPRAVRKSEFNEAGFKTAEYVYGYSTHRVTYTYDERGELAAKEEFAGGRMLSTWKRTHGPSGTSTELIRNNDDGSVVSRVLQEFDAAGNKTVDISYDAKGDVARSWQHRRSGDGAVTTLDVNRGETERTDYDAQGRITYMRRGTGSALQKWSYSYDTQGRVAEARYTDDDARSPEVHTFAYDTAGTLVEVLHAHSSGVPVNRRRYTYSARGFLEAETVAWFDSEGTLDRTWYYRYDAAGNVLEKELQHARRPYSCRRTYRYDDHGHLATEIFYDSHDRIVTLAETTWDGGGHKLSERSSGRMVDPGFQVRHEYDEAGRLLETVRFDLENHQLSRESLRYNERGHLEESARYNPDGSLVTNTRYDYAYDGRGNWIERITLVTNNAQESYDWPTEHLFREIHYYP